MIVLDFKQNLESFVEKDVISWYFCINYIWKTEGRFNKFITALEELFDCNKHILQVTNMQVCRLITSVSVVTIMNNTEKLIDQSAMYLAVATPPKLVEDGGGTLSTEPMHVTNAKWVDYLCNLTSHFMHKLERI